MYTKIIDQLEAINSEELDSIAGNLGALEEAVKAKIQELRQGLLQRLANRRVNGYKDSFDKLKHRRLFLT